MPYEELLGWYDYFERRPVEWRADDRAAKLLQAQGVKEKPYRIFASLDAIYNPMKEELPAGMISGNSLKGSFLFHNMLGAVGGDIVEL